VKLEATCSSETSVDFNGLHGFISQKIELSADHSYQSIAKVENVLIVTSTLSKRLHGAVLKNSGKHISNFCLSRLISEDLR
jgi:hypothetical protein